MFSSAHIGFLLSCLTVGISSRPIDSYVDWQTFQATGVNLGGWLIQEPNIDPYWWGIHGGTPDMDEWTWCENLGDQCGPILEERYSTYITTDFIDKLAGVGTGIIRIPTTYAAWIKVPGSQLYSGNQVSHLDRIARYAIEQHNMHVIVDLHGLPGGINYLTIGEATGHIAWFNSTQNLDLSLQAVDQVVEYIQNSGHPQHYTLEPINEPQDNLTGLFTPYALTPPGQAWVKTYFDAVVGRVAAVNPKIPVMLQTFLPETYWSPQFATEANIVFDIHKYYFENKTVSSDTVAEAFCADAKDLAGDGKFPVFFGEWAIQTGANNSFAPREHNLQTAEYAHNHFAQGGAMWTGRFFGNVSVDGEGTQADYWNYEYFVDSGYIKPVVELSNLC